MIPKEVVVFSLKRVFRYAFFPNFVFATLLIWAHWFLTGLWLYLNHGIYSIEKELLIGFLSSVLPLIAYQAWGVKRFVKKAYLIIHESIVSVWLDFFSLDMAREAISNAKPLDNELLLKWKKYLEEKTEALPALIRFIVKVVARKIGLRKEFFDQFNEIKNKDESALAELIHVSISNVLIEKSENVVPRFFTYLLIVNTIFLVSLWFF